MINYTRTSTILKNNTHKQTIIGISEDVLSYRMKPLTSSMLMKKIKDKSADIGTFLGPANREFWAMGRHFCYVFTSH